MLDEVSHVLQHFQPKPDFVLNEFQRQQLGRRRSTERRARFSCVQYQKHCHKLRLTYDHDQSFLLQFHVFLARPQSNEDKEKEATPMSVTFVDGCDSIPSCLKQNLRACCCDLSSAKHTSTSLFSILSSLLHTLQTLPRSSTSAIVVPLTPQRLVIVIDVAVLLLRCAAASRRSATLCSPVPQQFCNQEGFLKHSILPFTDRRERYISSGQVPSIQTASGRSEQKFLTFLLSLPWTNGATIQTMTTGLTARICLNLDMGDPSPHFTKRAQQNDTLTVFHGSNPENVWSILNYGLLELSGTNLVENGAMLGKGIYSSTSYEVASFFAKNNASTNHNSLSWRHASLLRLLSIPSQKRLTEATTVSCFAVFEATILAPDQNDGTRSTRREGKYFVVPNGDDIRLTKLHLTFHLGQKTKERRMLVPTWFLVILAVGSAYLLQTIL